MNTIKNVLPLVFMFMTGCGSITPTNVADSIELNLTPTVIKPNDISDTCLQEEHIDLGKLDLSGKIFLSQDNKYRVFDVATDSFVDIPENAHLSPDGEKVAQYDNDKQGVEVSTLTGNLISFFPRDAQWFEANSALYDNTSAVQFDWWNNHFLYIRSLPVGSQLMLDIETGKTHKIEFPYSKEVWSLGGAMDIRNNYVGFSPDLDEVIYASTASHLVLRNNSIYPDGTWRTVTWVGFSSTYSIPRWSPDSSTFILVIDSSKNTRNIENLFQVSADSAVGEKQLTDLGSLFNNPYQILINQFDWSPDGSKVALTVHIALDEGGKSISRLLVLDVETGNIEDYCNPDPDTPYSSNGYFSFIWSPDGKYIATDTAIVDLASRVAYKFPDLYIVDWAGEGKNR